MTSQLCNASCFERIATSNANANLKQPLVVGQHLEPSSPSQEEQNTDIARRRVSLLILIKSFCVGAFVGLLLQAVTFSAFWVFTIHWGKNPQSAPFLRFWTIYPLMHLDVAFYAIVWVACAMTLTRKGSMYMRKKFDNDADAPNSESVWTARFLYLSGTGFLIGLFVGSYGAWAIVDIALGMPVPLALIFSILLVDVGLCCLMIKCFDWYQELSLAEEDEPEEDQEESFFV